MRSFQSISILLSAAFALLASSATATDLVAGRPYNGPQRIEVRAVSTAFTLPKGMAGKLTGDVFTMGHRTLPGLILGTARANVTGAQLKQELNGPIPLDDGVSLRLKSPLKTKGETTIGHYRGDGVVGFAVARRHRSGRAIGFIAVAQSAKALKPLRTIAEKMARSVAFQAPPKVDATWKGRLSGRTFKLFNTTSTTTSQKTLYLCANGRFRYRSSASGSSVTYGAGGSGVSFAGSSGSRGTWRVVNNGNAAEIRLKDEESGEAFRFTVARNAKGHLLFNGERWLRDARVEPRCD